MTFLGKRFPCYVVSPIYGARDFSDKYYHAQFKYQIKFVKFLVISLKQAWAKIIYMRAIIYLNMKKLHARAENLYNSPVYSLDFYHSTNFFWDQHVT
jgi:hypothetical protein